MLTRGHVKANNFPNLSEFNKHQKFQFSFQKLMRNGAEGHLKKHYIMLLYIA